MTIYPEFKEGILSELTVNGSNIIHPWGIEFADATSFFSLTGDGWGAHVSDKEIITVPNGVQVTQTVHLDSGKFRLAYQDIVREDQTVYRKASVTALEDSYLLDFVLRYRFIQEPFAYGQINKQRIEHKNLYIYHQYKSDSAQLIGKKLQATVRRTAYDAANLTGYSYIRDARDEWILHSRLLPANPDTWTIKFNARWYNNALPSFFSWPLLLPPIRDRIAYWTERKPHQTSRRFLSRVIGSYPLIQLKKGESIMQENVIHIENVAL